MPTYEYRCPDGHEFEKFVQKISLASAELPCPVCGKTAERRISAGGGLVFKGSGFYITDYGKDGKKDLRANAAAASSRDKNVVGRKGRRKFVRRFRVEERERLSSAPVGKGAAGARRASASVQGATRRRANRRRANRRSATGRRASEAPAAAPSAPKSPGPDK